MTFASLLLSLLALAQLTRPSLPPTPRPVPTVTPRPTSAPQPTPTPATVLFPFVMPSFDAAPSATDVSWLNPAPAGASGFVRVQGEHFVDGQNRVLRFWGVNLNFAGVFPSKAQAPFIAGRLAKFGFNAVRLHHFDGYPAPNGIWRAAAIGSSRLRIPREMDAEQLDRFDFFCAELLKRGIYLNVNLHVGRKSSEADGVPEAARLPEKDKGTTFFDERLIGLQQEWAKTLLTHVNPYTRRALKDEPGVCAVELLNEDSLLGMWLDDDLAKIPSSYSFRLREGWNAWLHAHYADDATLRAAWTELDVPVQPDDWFARPLPANIINPNAPDARKPVAMRALGRVTLSAVGGGRGTLSLDDLSGPTVDGFVRPGLTANLQQAGGVPWAFQLQRDGLDFKSGPYTLSFWARADTSRRISVNIWQDRAPNRFLGFTGYADLTSDWQQFTFVFRATDPDPEHGRLTWTLGQNAGVVQLGEVTLREGGRIAPPLSWNLSTGVPLPVLKTTAVVRVRRDFAEFLGEVEAGYARKMRDNLRGLGVRVPIWTTQAQFGGWGGVWREREADAVDVHAYWKHPDFGAEGWNGNKWTIDNLSMTQFPGVDPLSAFSLGRIEGKPFVVSEWNSGQPNDFGGESLLMIAAWAAWHDWAGVWLFDYHSNGSYDRDKIEGFFSIDSHPVKMATAPAAAMLFRRTAGETRGQGDKAMGGQLRPASLPLSAPPLVPLSLSIGDVLPSTSSVTLTLPPDWVWDQVAESPGGPTAAPWVRTWTQAGASRETPFRGRVGVKFEDGAFPTVSESAQSYATQNRQTPNSARSWTSDTGQMSWSDKPGLWTLNAARSKAIAGFLGGKRADLGAWRVQMPSTANNFAVLSLSSLDGQDISASHRLLLTVAGRAENMAMPFNAARNSLTNGWGDGPVQVEGVPAMLTLLSDNPNLRVWALDQTGARKGELSVLREDGALYFSVGPKWRTLWYEIGE